MSKNPLTASIAPRSGTAGEATAVIFLRSLGNFPAPVQGWAYEEVGS